MRFHRLRLFHDKITPGTRKAGGKGKGKGSKGKGDKRVFGDVSDDEEEYRFGKKKLKYDSDEDDDLVKHRRSTRIKSEVKKEVKAEVKNELSGDAIKDADSPPSPMPGPMAFYADIKTETALTEHEGAVGQDIEAMVIKQELGTTSVVSSFSEDASMANGDSSGGQDFPPAASLEVPTTAPSLVAENNLTQEDPKTEIETTEPLVPSNAGAEMENLATLVSVLPDTAISSEH
jgi:hypothetical protein